MAPRGQMTLQKKRWCPIAATTTANSIPSLSVKENMSVVPFITAQGIADSIVATGHNRQKKSWKPWRQKKGNSDNQPGEDPIFYKTLSNEGCRILYRESYREDPGLTQMDIPTRIVNALLLGRQLPLFR